jgi:hypothetical protein
MQIVRPMDIIAPGVPRIQVDATQVDHPYQVLKVRQQDGCNIGVIL